MQVHEIGSDVVEPLVADLAGPEHRHRPGSRPDGLADDHRSLAEQRRSDEPAPDGIATGARAVAGRARRDEQVATLCRIGSGDLHVGDRGAATEAGHIVDESLDLRVVEGRVLGHERRPRGRQRHPTGPQHEVRRSGSDPDQGRALG